MLAQNPTTDWRAPRFDLVVTESEDRTVLRLCRCASGEFDGAEYVDVGPLRGHGG